MSRATEAEQRALVLDTSPIARVLRGARRGKPSDADGITADLEEGGGAHGAAGGALPA